MKVVLYDVGDRRGWLIDGASALLHITRTQLSSSPYSDSDLFKLETFQHADPRGPFTARKALLDSTNRTLVIFEEVETFVESIGGIGEAAKSEIKTKTTRWTYQDLVRQTYHVLEQIHDYQTKMSTSPVISLRFSEREKLTGFAFMDIVDVQNDLRPRIAKLNSSGRGWVDFIRSIGAFTLLGKGFGEIIKPSIDTNQLCKNWKHVPTGKDYLVACTSTLKEICKRQGNYDSNPLELASGVYWHNPDKLFEPCECKSKGCDRVQVLLPRSFGTKKHPRPFDCDNGAVIFGRSWRFPWHWPSEGDPVEGGSSENEDEASDFHDSGLGSNLSQSASNSANIGPQSITSECSDATDRGLGDVPNIEHLSGHSGSDLRLSITPGISDSSQRVEAEVVHLATSGTANNGEEPGGEPGIEGETVLRNRSPSTSTNAKGPFNKVKGLGILSWKWSK
jgi:hypothetical protein